VKKKEMPLLACESVSCFGSVGLSVASPATVEVNIRPLRPTKTVEATALPEAARSGVLKFLYFGTKSCSR
jgi:Trk-type K+ transport system membrane component